MKRFVEGEDRRQGVLLPEFFDDYVAEDNPVRAIDVFVDKLDLRGLGFSGVVPEVTGRPAYELCRKIGDGVNQAADLISATASIPSLNFIPLTTFGNWF
jgi:hypothetical protein